jgi:hypothetical protein
LRYFPKNNEYIRNYVQYIREGKAGVLYGGIIYESVRPDKRKFTALDLRNKKRGSSLDLRNKKNQTAAP